MSDWVIDDSNDNKISDNHISNTNDWEIVSENISQPEEKESFGYSASMAIPRVASDLAQSLYYGVQKIPSLYESSKTEIPNALNLIRQNPQRAGLAGLAGLAEAGQNVFNFPHDIANYISERLHLLPEDINKKIQMARMPEDTNQLINKTFGEQQYPGESFIRGTGRNALNILGLGAVSKTLNPMQLTNKGIANKVVNELKNQSETHTKMYNKLWKNAERQGFNQVPLNMNALAQDLNLIKKSYTPKQYESINNLLNHPTLQNAQKAQSDLGVLRRALEEKSKTTPLLEGEKNIYESLYNAEKNIENNMFKNSSGQLNQKLANKYKKISKSYRENVVPYKYNPDIQDYLSKDITAKQLVRRLNEGPFAAKKGGFLTHPQFGIRNALLPLLGGIGVVGGGKYLYDQLLGNPLSTGPQNQ